MGYSDSKKSLEDCSAGLMIVDLTKVFGHKQDFVIHSDADLMMSSEIQSLVH